MRNIEISDFLCTNMALIRKLNCKKQCVEILDDIYILKEKIAKFFDKRLEFNNEKNENEFFRFLNDFFYKADRFESLVKNDQLISKVKNFFRSSVSEFLEETIFVKHGYLKPKGYPGDYEIIEAMYNNKPISKNRGFLLDKYFLQNDYVQAVRDRKDRMKNILRKVINESDSKVIRILNMACGSCREVRELINERSLKKINIHFILLDQESAALEFAKKNMSRIPRNWKLIFVRENILNLLDNKSSIVKKFGEQDLIYSIGLADYLPNSILGLMIRNCFLSLSAKGELIIAHKNVNEFSSPISDWGANWKFIPRTPTDLYDLVRAFLVNKKYFKDLFFEEQRRVFFLILSRHVIEIDKYLK